MPAVTTEALAPDRVGGELSLMLVLVRIACEGGATRAEIVRDLAPFVAHRLSPAEWRAAAEAEIAALGKLALVASIRHRYAASAQGTAMAAAFLGQEPVSAVDWPEQRDVRLVAKALAIPPGDRAKLKAIARPEGLRAVIVQRAFGLPIRPAQSANRLRSQLAAVALARAFGGKVKGAGAGLSGKTGRVLAGHLSRHPRDFGSDGRLIAALAAEQIDARQADANALRLALMRAFVNAGLETSQSIAAPARQRPPAAPAINVGNDTAAASHRPDLVTFAREVHAAAALRAQGWPGHRKAYISHVWQAIRVACPAWALSEIEFKCMLAEAHRAGRVALAGADLKDKRDLEDLRRSAITDRNSVWHFVRVET
jgi:hypothetical protein